MNRHELSDILHALIDGWENEVVEFKNVGDSYSTHDIGKYFSALSSEANLRGLTKAWLVFGVDNKTRKVTGSDYRVESDRLQGLKHQISQDSEPPVTFRDIHVLEDEKGRVILFEIPAAPQGIPISWKGHYYARAGESLTALGLDKLDSIRAQSVKTDWSAQSVSDATIQDLDPDALAQARTGFARKHANRFTEKEVMTWNERTFLDRAKLTLHGKITRATLLLLGKTESAALLSPHPVQMTWKLEGVERAYEHFSAPFLLNTGALYRKIRNIQLRILPEDQLIHVEVAKYDQKIVLEALHNCIAHQDYSRHARILVTECVDKLVFQNNGSFFDGVPQDYITGTTTPTRYRNPFLAQAMAELNMIDTMGYGIHGMYVGQAKRYFPLPDFDTSESGIVRVTIYGGVVDPAYSRMLIEKTDLSLPDILALDRIQKHLLIDSQTAQRLRKVGLIEGRKPNLHIAATIAAITGEKAQYIRTRRQDDAFYQKLAADYIKQFGSASRKDLDDLLLSKLPDGMLEERKRARIHNLLTKFRKEGIIRRCGAKKNARWELARTAETSVLNNK